MAIASQTASDSKCLHAVLPLHESPFLPQRTPHRPGQSLTGVGATTPGGPVLHSASEHRWHALCVICNRSLTGQSPPFDCTLLERITPRSLLSSKHLPLYLANRCLHLLMEGTFLYTKGSLPFQCKHNFITFQTPSVRHRQKTPVNVS